MVFFFFFFFFFFCSFLLGFAFCLVFVVFSKTLMKVAGLNFVPLIPTVPIELDQLIFTCGAMRIS